MRHFCVIFLLATACSPYLQYRRDDARAFGFTAPCGQGPFVLTTRLKGAQWGEKLLVTGFTRHNAAGRYSVKLDGKSISEGNFGTHHLVNNGTAGVWEVDNKPQNARCVERPAEVVAAPPSPQVEVLEPPPMPPPWPAAPVQPELAPPPQQVPVAPVAVQPLADQEPAQLVVLTPDQIVDEASRNLRVVGFTWESNDDIGTPVVPADGLIEVTLWSQEPNDWEGSTLQLIHEVAEPSVPAAEYIAFRHKERLERDADAKQRQAEANAEWAARIQRCQAHHEDEECWGKGGYDAYQKAYLAPRPQPPPQAQPVVVEKPAAPPPRAPDGPPPAAQTETAPPQPSPHAEWIAGYWKWTGFAWFWLGGWWKVPQQDLVAQTTTVAPAPPPQLVMELRPPPPLPDAVWLAGAWYWDGRAWLWHAGQWTMAPRSGLLWQPPTWVIDGRGVRLLPGLWHEVLGPPRR